MRQLFSKTDVQVLSSVLAVLLLLTTIPLSYGVVIAGDSTQPEFTLNICSPVQIFDRASNTLLARPATNLPQFNLFFTGPLAPSAGTLAVECSIIPETPPPKRLV
jgi:hypothetical protein